MNLSALDYALWAAGLIGQAALFLILMLRRRWKEFPVFTVFMGFDAVLGPVLYALFQYGFLSWYARVYWSQALIDFVLQLGIVFEIARIVMRPTGTWVRDARKQFILWGAAGILVTRTSKSLGLGWRNHVMALGNGWTAWAVVAILVDGLHSYFGAERYFRELEHVRMFAYLTALGYWMVQFWLEEPARQPISPQLSAYIQVLHRRIQNDLDTLGAQR